MNTFSNKFTGSAAESAAGLVAEYIWIDGYGELRSKIKILAPGNYSIDNLPVWNFDGSSTNQASANRSEVLIRPVQMYKNPFHPGGFLVLCDTFVQDMGTHQITPHQHNTRSAAMQTFQMGEFLQPWFGIEQEYYMIESGVMLDSTQNHKSVHPYGRYEQIPEQKMFYCGTTHGQVKGRKLAEAHMHACLYAGLKVSGINAEVGPSQWEYQIGPVEGIEAADQLFVSRYILLRLAEEAEMGVTFNPKPFGNNWSGSGAHTNFSTIHTRVGGGYTELLKIIEELRKTHDGFVRSCGENNHLRLTGEHETAAMNTFSYGVGSRDSSIRIPQDTFHRGCGYMEDRRPGANMDPYIVTSALVDAALKALTADQEIASAE